MARTSRESRGATVVLGTVGVAIAVLLTATIRAQAQPAAGPCRLQEAGSENLPSTTCRECHPWDRCHPVDVEYAAAVAKDAFDLRRADVAVQRGAFLPEGQVRCVSCHDRDSAEPFRLAIRREPRTGAAPDATPARHDPELKPLCAQCHMRD
jgi:hypothetical protein